MGSHRTCASPRELNALDEEAGRAWLVEGRTLGVETGGRRPPTACPASRAERSDWASTSFLTPGPEATKRGQDGDVRDPIVINRFNDLGPLAPPACPPGRNVTG